MRESHESKYRFNIKLPGEHIVVNKISNEIIFQYYTPSGVYIHAYTIYIKISTYMSVLLL